MKVSMSLTHIENSIWDLNSLEAMPNTDSDKAVIP